ncbi:hypothetical protein [Streptomyces fructofermentans]|uniref:Uncharacterized protein n=1 Tax=Streptomyces fructofermentans TaxID=152141 RepID=A0A918NA34_9ACTN|nr:hypothetical protein [Streptomyces fructofermentans]GGX57659.1 hypothetical protein GCM10010515_26610 [Streptomyces fructofermentans]
MSLNRRAPFALVLSANLRRHAGPLVALAVAVAVAYAYYERISAYEPPDWVATGDDTGSAARGIAGAAAGLLAGWQGGAEDRVGAGWMRETSARSPLAHRLMGLVSGVVWPLTGYLVAVAAVLVRPGPEGQVNRAPLDAMTVDAAFVVAVSCVAYLLGQTFPFRVTPLALALGAALLGASWQTLVPLDITYSGDPLPREAAAWAPATPPAWLPWCRAVLVASVGVAAVLVCARRRRWGAVLAAASVLAALGLGTTHPNGTTASAFNPVEVRCRGHAPVVCVSADHESRRAHLERLVARVSERLAGVREAPTHYVWTDDTSCGGIDDVGAPWAVGISGSEPDRSHLAIAISVTSSCDSFYSAQTIALYTWLLGRDGVPSADAAEYGPAALPVGERVAWLNRTFTAMKRGTPLPPLPDVRPGARPRER